MELDLYHKDPERFAQEAMKAVRKIVEVVDSNVYPARVVVVEGDNKDVRLLRRMGNRVEVPKK